MSILYPEMALVRQKLHLARLENLRDETAKALEALHLKQSVKPGGSVAVGVGSRSISQTSIIVYECIKRLKELGLRPFVVPAMGSHGGNTAEGERAFLARLGITESSIGAPIQATEGLVEIGSLEIGIPILMDGRAAEADHIVVINRVKPHTKCQPPLGSGLTKILTIGLGRGQGAALYHQAAVQHSFGIIQEAACHILKSRSILFGLAILEDGYRNVSRICAVSPKDWFETERTLLKEASAMMARIPLDPIDILIIDEIGKEISGIGMDANVTGRHRDIIGDYYKAPHVKRIFVRALSARSDGNANGIGLADVTTRRLLDAIDFEKTYINALTAISPEKAAIPMYFETDRKCLEACLNTIGIVTPEAARIIRIKNTATLDTLLASRAFESQIMADPNLQIIQPWEPMAFNKNDNLEGLW